MKILKFFFLLAVATFCFGSCGEPCEGTVTDLGMIALEEKSNDFLPYVGHETLIFKNESGDELKLVGNQLQRTTTHDEGATCWSGFVRFATQSFDTFEKEQLSISFVEKTNTLNPIVFHLTLEIGNSSEGSREDNYFLYDMLSFNLENIDRNPFWIMTSRRGRTDIDRHSVKRNQIITSRTQARTFFNQTFEKVFNLTGENQHFYYKKEKGIIAFSDNNGELWVLDRMIRNSTIVDTQVLKIE